MTALAHVEGANALDVIKDSIPDFAKDIRLNFGSVLSPTGAPDLTQSQIFSIALATSYALADAELTQALEDATRSEAGEAAVTAAKTAASLMAMNNIYYRFTHYVENAAISGLPAKLRMQAMANPGVEKVDFELMSLAVSSVNGCGKCMAAHSHELSQHGTTPLAIQSAVRIAAVLHAAAQARRIQ